MATSAKTCSGTAHIPEQSAQKVDLTAERLWRSKNLIDKLGQHNCLTREALADVDSGRVIDHLDVQAWADSLNTDTPLPVPR